MLVVLIIQMREPAEPAGDYQPRPPSSVLYVNNFTPIFLHAHPQHPPYPYPQQHSPNQSFSPHYSPEEADMQRKYSGTLGSTYDYRSQLVYPNSEPFRKDLDRKLTTIEHEELNQYQSRILVRPSLFPQETPPTHPEQYQEPICFNLCCILILVIGLVSLSVCVYLVLFHESKRSAEGGAGGFGSVEHLFLRRFNI